MRSPRAELTTAERMTKQSAKNVALEERVSELKQQLRWARQDLENAHLQLDEVGVPRYQKNNYPYSLLGRLSKMCAQTLGQGYMSVLHTAQAQRDECKRELHRILNEQRPKAISACLDLARRVIRDTAVGFLPGYDEARQVLLVLGEPKDWPDGKLPPPGLSNTW